MVDVNWENDRIVLTPINLYMEYILLSYNDFLKKKLTDIEITYGELTYIYNIKFYPSISQRELSETLFVSEANVAKMVKKLVKKGLVEKKKDESNKSRNILNEDVLKIVKNISLLIIKKIFPFSLLSYE